MKSEPGYPIQLDAVFAHGGDYIRVDPDGKRVRLEVSSLLKDKSGAFVRFDYSGVVPLTGPAGKVLGGAADAKTTEQGEICKFCTATLVALPSPTSRSQTEHGELSAFTVAHVTFSSGDAALKVLEDKVYVSSGRFILEDGKPVTVEYRISEVGY